MPKDFLLRHLFFFIPGGILEVDNSCTINGIEVLITNKDIQYWLTDGWIKEIQELKFTKNDMIDFASSCIIKWETEPKGRINYVNEFDKFKNTK